MKQFAYSALLTLFSMVFALILMEASLRYLNIGYGNAPVESDPIFHHVHPQSYSFLSHSPGGEFGGHQVSYDQNGLVTDPDGAAAKKADCRIAFLGDSFTEAGQISYKKSFAGLLDSATDCQVRNYGVSSYSPFFYNLQWKYLVRQWRPNLVIVQLFSNDIDADERYLGQAKLSEDGKPVAIPGPSGGWIFKQMRKSYVLRLFRKFQLTFEWTLAHWGEEKNIAGDFVEENPDISDTSSNMMILLNKEVVRSGAELAFFVVPSKYRLRHKNRKYAKLEYADKWKLWASAKGIEFIDLVPPFKNAALSGKRLFYDRDIHFNENGHAIAASTIQRAYAPMFKAEDLIAGD